MRDMQQRTDRSIWITILTAILLFATVVFLSAQEPPKGEAKPAAPAAAPTYVGSAACKGCHAKLHDPWATSAHGKALGQDSLPSEVQGCEACHGPASAHVGNPTQTKPSIPKPDDPAKVMAVCGGCHFKSDSSKAPKEWQNLSSAIYARSRHGRKNVSCVACHTGHPNGNDKQLIKPVGQLCVGCHSSMLESSPGKKAAYTHSPVATGQCLMCHDPHGTPGGRMVVQEIGKVCQGCHDTSDAKLVTAHKGYTVGGNCLSCHDPHSHDKNAKLITGKQHAPFKQGNCETCHAKPVAGQPIALAKPAQELCFTCHAASTLMPANEKAHAPVKEGLCTTCHDPHVSGEKGLLKNKQANVCFTCHTKIEDATVAPHRHKVLEETMNCVLCHKPHSSPRDSLLAKDEMALCGQCHKHSFSHPMEKKADGTPVINPTTKTPLICSGCHEMHGSKFASMTLSEKNKDLCVGCHANTEH